MIWLQHYQLLMIQGKSLIVSVTIPSRLTWLKYYHCSLWIKKVAECSQGEQEFLKERKVPLKKGV